MDGLKTSLDHLHQSIKKLEEAVVLSTQQKNENKERIQTLHNAIVLAYERMDKALVKLKKGEK